MYPFHENMRDVIKFLWPTIISSIVDLRICIFNERGEGGRLNRSMRHEHIDESTRQGREESFKVARNYEMSRSLAITM